MNKRTVVLNIAQAVGVGCVLVALGLLTGGPAWPLLVFGLVLAGAAELWSRP